MATKTTEEIDGKTWTLISISQGETIDEIRAEFGDEPWMNCFVPTDTLYNMTFYFEPISGDYRIDGIIDGDAVEVIGNINKGI